MTRPYTLHDPQYAPPTWEPTRRSGHRTDAHRKAIHGRIVPMDYGPGWLARLFGAR